MQMGAFMITEGICMGCLEPTDMASATCPACGYNNEEPKPASSHHLFPRTMLKNKYLIGKCICEDGFNILYIGYDTVNKRKIAINEYFLAGYVIRESSASANVRPFTISQGYFFESGRDRFMDEAETLAKITNMPGVPSVWEYFIENGTAYIIMEYFYGLDLQSLYRIKELAEARNSLQSVRSIPKKPKKNIVQPFLEPFQRKAEKTTPRKNNPIPDPGETHFLSNDKMQKYISVAIFALICVILVILLLI